MQTLLTDIELDIKELKYLIDTIERDPQSPLKDVARRSIGQMHAHLNALAQQLDAQIPVTSEEPAVQHAFSVQPTEPVEPIVPEEVLVPVMPIVEPAPTVILADRIKRAGSLRKAMSLNDTFRSARELFGGDSDKMNETLLHLEGCSSADEAIRYVSFAVDDQCDEETLADFTELIRKFYN
ncbi:MAG: hypothetical protein KA961_08245 [Bacteroides sp.]|nr:hypothetical protein [Bacteroides sp.]